VRWRCVDLQHLILTRWNIAYHERTIGKLLRRLGFRHISARPRHLGQDPAELEAFKNVWPAPSASSFDNPIRAVCVNVSGLSASAAAKMEIRASRSS